MRNAPGVPGHALTFLGRLCDCVCGTAAGVHGSVSLELPCRMARDVLQRLNGAQRRGSGCRVSGAGSCQAIGRGRASSTDWSAAQGFTRRRWHSHELVRARRRHWKAFLQVFQRRGDGLHHVLERRHRLQQGVRGADLGPCRRDAGRRSLPQALAAQFCRLSSRASSWFLEGNRVLWLAHFN